MLIGTRPPISQIRQDIKKFLNDIKDITITGVGRGLQQLHQETVTDAISFHTFQMVRDSCPEKKVAFMRLG